jgi:exosortase A-associated hydrolase 1
MGVREEVFGIDLGGERLQAILHRPETPARVALLLIVGGPQYRVGSHRQFVLLARDMADAGYAVLRFDYRGMGDSTGGARDFEQIGEDVRIAADSLVSRVVGVEELVLWGLCDAASAACFYAGSDRRVRGLVLLNPWVRTEAGIAKAYLRHYYVQRLFSRDFWRKLGSGKLDLVSSMGSLAGLLGRAIGGDDDGSGDSHEPTVPLPQRMYEGLVKFGGRTLVILSGNDLTAAEFSDLVAGSNAWRRLLARPQFQRRELKDANHTFSRRIWRDRVSDWTRGFLDELSGIQTK